MEPGEEVGRKEGGRGGSTAENRETVNSGSGTALYPPCPSPPISPNPPPSHPPPTHTPTNSIPFSDRSLERLRDSIPSNDP